MAVNGDLIGFPNSPARATRSAIRKLTTTTAVASQLPSATSRYKILNSLLRFFLMHSSEPVPAVPVNASQIKSGVIVSTAIFFVLCTLFSILTDVVTKDILAMAKLPITLTLLQVPLYILQLFFKLFCTN